MRRTLIVALLLLAAALPAAAQSLTGTVSGVVKDEQGGVLPGVVVTLTGRTGARTTVTDVEGVYRFAAVNPGTYALSTELQGFRPKRQDNVLVGIGTVVETPFVLKVGGVTEAVDVVGEAAVVDVASSTTENTLSQDMLFNLPIRPTNAATDLLNLAPGVHDGVAFGGNSDYGSALLVDGVDTRDPDAGSAWTFFNFNIVEEVQVGGLGANAEYGSYTGAIVNTLTKSGSNRYSGLFDAYWTKSSFASDNASAANTAANPTLAESAIINKRLDLTGQLGGPLIKDKLFFFLSAQRFEDNEKPTGPRTQTTEVSPRFNAKLTWQPGPNDSVSANFQYDFYNVTGRASIGSNLDTDANTVNQDSPEAIYGLQWRHLFGTQTFAEAKFTGWWGYYYLDPKVNVPLHYDAATGGYGPGAWTYGYFDRTRNQLNASISHYAEGFGKHDLKFGVEIERSSVHSRYGYSQGLYYYDDTSKYPAGQYLAYEYHYDVEGHNHRESVYAQDAWKPTPRLTINAGVRVDFIRGISPVLDKTVYSNTNWAPRLGLAYDLTGDGRTVLKAHYGQYYDGIYFQQYSKAVPGLVNRISYAYDPAGTKCGPAGNCFTEFASVPSPLYGVDPNMKHPRVDEWTAGFERALSKDMSLAVTGIWRQDKNVQGTFYPDARWTPLALTSSTSGNDPTLQGIPVTAYDWANRNVSDNTPIYANADGFKYLDTNGNVIGVASGKRQYKGLMFVLDKRFTQRWQARLSYVLSKSEGVVDNGGQNTYGYRAMLFYQTPTNALVNSSGLTTYDRPHEVKLFATWQVPKIELGLNAYYRFLSGTTYTPYQRFGSSSINWPSSVGRTPFLEPRGDRRLDSESYLDLRLEKIFKLGAGSDRLSVYTDIQNVLNAGTITNVNTRWPTASVTTGDGASHTIQFGAPTALASPRTFILGARWSF